VSTHWYASIHSNNYAPLIIMYTLVFPNALFGFTFQEAGLQVITDFLNDDVPDYENYFGT